MTEIDKEKKIRDYRRNLLLLILISAGIDVAIFSFELPLVLTFMGAPLIVDELVEFVISYLLGKNRLRLKKRYKIAGFIPIPGITSLALQGLMEYIKSIRNPEKVLLQLDEPK